LYLLSLLIKLFTKIFVEQLTESQLRPRAVKLFEENYSYSVIAKKLGCSKARVSKWVTTDSLQNYQRLHNRSALSVAAQKIEVNTREATHKPAKN